MLIYALLSSIVASWIYALFSSNPPCFENNLLTMLCYGQRLWRRLFNSIKCISFMILWFLNLWTYKLFHPQTLIQCCCKPQLNCWSCLLVLEINLLWSKHLHRRISILHTFLAIDSANTYQTKVAEIWNDMMHLKSEILWLQMEIVPH